MATNIVNYMATLKHEDTINEEEIYFNFINSIKSEVTKKTYERSVNLFVQFCGVNRLSELLSFTDPQKQIIKYLMTLRERGLSFNSISTELNGIYHLYDMNDIVLNRKKMINTDPMISNQVMSQLNIVHIEECSI